MVDVVVVGVVKDMVVVVFLVEVKSGGDVVVDALGRYGGKRTAVIMCSTPLLHVYSLPVMATPATVTVELFTLTRANSSLFIVRFVISVKSRMYSAPLYRW